MGGKSIQIDMIYKPTVKSLKKRLKRVKNFTTGRQKKVLLNDIIRATYEAIDYAFGSGGEIEHVKGKMYLKKRWIPNDELTRKWKARYGYPQVTGQTRLFLINSIPRGNSLGSKYFKSTITGNKITMRTLRDYVEYFNSGIGGRQPARPFTPTQSVLDSIAITAIQKRWKKYNNKAVGAI